jgi:Transcriptional regulators
MHAKPKNDRPSLKLMRLAMEFGAIEKRIRNYGTDVAIHEAEIHMIKAVKEADGIHVTGLAERFGVTKGAVSQMLIKLEKKNLVTKEPDSANLSRLQLTLTPKGEHAYARHEELHATFDRAVEDQLARYPEAFKADLSRFMDAMNTVLADFKD